MNKMICELCEDCIHLKGEGPSMEYPYPTVWCSKGHQMGKDCGDFDDGVIREIISSSHI